jgi:hypothetical protein
VGIDLEVTPLSYEAVKDLANRAWSVSVDLQMVLQSLGDIGRTMNHVCVVLVVIGQVMSIFCSLFLEVTNQQNHDEFFSVELQLVYFLVVTDQRMSRV